MLTRTALPRVVAGVALSMALSTALVGCSDDGATEPAAGKAPAPLVTVPADVAALSQTVGEYVATPGEDVPEADVRATAATLSGTPGVQSAEVEEGMLRVQLLPTIGKADRERVLKALAALGQVDEGI